MIFILFFIVSFTFLFIHFSSFASSHFSPIFPAIDVHYNLRLFIDVLLERFFNIYVILGEHFLLKKS
jgi:hypothetical protein